MNKSLDTILVDLFALEPSLREHEDRVRSVVQAMLAAKPDTQFDQSFADKLKTQLLEAAPREERSWSFQFPVWSLASVGAIALALIAVAQFDVTPPTSPLTTTPGIADYGREGFGKLAFQPVSTGSERGGGGENTSLTADVPYVPTIYEYVLPDGWQDHLSLKQSGFIYRRPAANPLTDTLHNLLGDVPFGNLPISLQSVSGVNAEQNIQASYDGYNNALYLTYGNVPPTSNGSGTVKSPEELIALARLRAEELNIDLRNMGTPYIHDYTYTTYLRANAEERATLLADGFSPVLTSVVFPQLLDGTTVHYNGEITVTLNQETGEVASIVLPLDWHVAERSEYPLLTDTNKINEFFRWGGTVDPKTWAGSEYQVQTVHLGEPTLVYSPQSSCPENGGVCEDFLVPSLQAPVIETENGYWMPNVIIPLTTSL